MPLSLLTKSGVSTINLWISSGKTYLRNYEVKSSCEGIVWVEYSSLLGVHFVWLESLGEQKQMRKSRDNGRDPVIRCHHDSAWDQIIKL